jgi:hypothetical protein
MNVSVAHRAIDFERLTGRFLSILNSFAKTAVLVGFWHTIGTLEVAARNFFQLNTGLVK